MPDICKCNNKNCPIKETCYRFMCENDYHQAYSKFYYQETINFNTGKKQYYCDHFMKMK